ncbi:hypothetical protein LNKW23_24800 [Paralimibaculum aggregatum]|uniref:DUF3311 domain-containing protein n=1 Tax=Paralimibaculum aggregatum TaxID=3036245 RepID=A0ABQ6LJ06_9RHOB|nr:hypothetical protein [Limibaculum sp. NKW23]GMG83267.1 hypothetical protein LNKW23_24800 [Limibaculum sp. NKW23]
MTAGAPSAPERPDPPAPRDPGVPPDPGALPGARPDPLPNPVPMTATAPDPDAASDIALRARKRRDAALLLPVSGVVLLMPPMAEIFAVEGTVLGVPLVVAYVFAVWFCLIVLAARIAHRLEP